MADDETTQVTDDEILRYTQGVRRRYINHLIEDQFPVDPKEQRLMLTALADMDRQALGNKRIQSEDKEADANQALAEILVKISEQHEALVKPSNERKGRIPDDDPSQLPDVEPVPGETAGAAVIDYDQIMAEEDNSDV